MDDRAHEGRGTFFDGQGAQAFDSLADDLGARVKGELEPGEQLLWADRSEPPDQRAGFVFCAFSALAMVLGFLGMIGMSRGWNRQRFSDGNEMFAGMAFMSLALAIVLGLFGNWRSGTKERERAAEVTYAITDRRAIIWSPDPKRGALRIRTISRGKIYSLVRVEQPDGSGSVLFNDTPRDFETDWYPVAFLHVGSVRRVELLVRNKLMGSERVS
jgi:hypothetical protein